MKIFYSILKSNSQWARKKYNQCCQKERVSLLNKAIDFKDSPAKKKSEARKLLKQLHPYKKHKQVRKVRKEIISELKNIRNENRAKLNAEMEKFNQLFDQFMKEIQKENT